MWLRKKKEHSTIENFIQLKDKASFDTLLKSKQDFVLLKHSFRCSISTTAYSRVDKFLTEKNATAYLIDVVADRELSLYVAGTVNVQHESPQWLTFKNGQVVSHSSHLSIYPS